MSIPVLNEVYTEVRRISIAGSVIAPGDFRLQKLIEPLRKSGEKAPIFTKVADNVQKLVESTEKTAAAALLELSALITSILYTQGATGIEGELKELPPSPVKSLQTKTNARVIKPLIEALTTTGSGRLELIRDAFERGLFNDLRLVRPTLQAIDDVYGEIGEFVATKVLPLFGEAIVPDLVTTLDLKGKMGHGRRLQLIHQLAPAVAREHVKKALEEGSKEVKLAAIECLGTAEEDLNFLLEQGRAKSQDVRAAAIAALMHSKDPQALSFLTGLLDGKDLSLVSRAVREALPEQVGTEAAQRLESSLADLLKAKDKDKQNPIAERISSLISVLRPRREKYLLLFTKLLGQSDELVKIKSNTSGLDLIHQLTQEVAECKEGGAEYLIENRDRLPADCFSRVAWAARYSSKPKDYFKIFSPYINTSAKKNTPEAVRSEQLIGTLHSSHRYYYGYTWSKDATIPPLDPAWIELAIVKDIKPIVYEHAIPKHAGTKQFLSAQWERVVKQKDPHELLDIAQAMLQSQHPDFEPLLLEQIKKVVSGKNSGYTGYWFVRMGQNLSPNAVPQLEALVSDAATVARFQNDLIDCIEAIKERAAKTTTA
jgi:hypothetical protein